MGLTLLQALSIFVRNCLETESCGGTRAENITITSIASAVQQNSESWHEYYIVILSNPTSAFKIYVDIDHNPAIQIALLIASNCDILIGNALVELFLF